MYPMQTASRYQPQRDQKLLVEYRLKAFKSLLGFYIGDYIAYMNRSRI